MFNRDKNTTAEKSFLASATLISAGTVLQGDLKSETDLRIDGTIYGNISSGAKVVIGPSGVVEGNIDGVQADISGKLVGNIVAKELVTLRTNSAVQGNITASNLQIDAGAVFNGQSEMGSAGNVVVMKEESVHVKAK